MSQWRLTDEANSSPIWSAGGLGKANSRAEANLAFGNTTSNAYFGNVTVGSYGVSSQEVQANNEGKTAGWALRTELANGRVRYETLVATKNITSDASDDAVLPDFTIVINTQPSGDTANTTAGENATFTVAAITAPTGGTIGFQWSYANGDSIQAGSNVGNTTQATLTVNSAVETANANFKVELSVSGGANVTSSNATLTITT